MLLLETILLLRAAKYSPSRRVRTLYCRIVYHWLEPAILTAGLILLALVIVTS